MIFVHCSFQKFKLLRFCLDCFWDLVEEKVKLFRETGKNPKLFRNPGYRMTALYTALGLSSKGLRER